MPPALAKRVALGRALGLVASSAEELFVAVIVATTSGERDDVIYLRAFGQDAIGVARLAETKVAALDALTVFHAASSGHSLTG